MSFDEQSALRSGDASFTTAGSHDADAVARLKNCWHVLTTSASVTDKPVGLTVVGEPIVVFRGEEGRAYALRDRCCHRGMPLSCGQIYQHHLMCTLHGWIFAGDGRCVRIPSQDIGRPIPERFRVQAHRCEEADGYIWVWLGDLPPPPVPRRPETAAGRWAEGCGEFGCDYRMAVENNVDGTHAIFLHPDHPWRLYARNRNSLGTSWKLEQRLTQGGLTSFWPVAATSDTPIPTDGSRVDLLLPGTVRWQLHFPVMGFTCLCYYDFVPVQRKSCRVFWRTALFDRDGIFIEAPEFTWEPTVMFNKFMLEDKAALERLQRIYGAEDGHYQRSVEADIPTLAAVKAMQLWEDGQWRGEDSPLPRRKIVETFQ